MQYDYTKQILDVCLQPSMQINNFHFNPTTESEWISINNLGSLLMALNTLNILTWYIWKLKISSIELFVTVGHESQ